jgi:hypothetical protein
MARTKEELTGQLVWSYVEYLRSEESAGPLSAAELDGLSAMLQTAGALPPALHPSCAEQAAPEVADRVRRIVAATTSAAGAAPAARPAAARRRPLLPPMQVPAWSFGVVLGALVALGGSLVSVVVWHTPAPGAAVRVYSERPADVERIDEQAAHRLIPRMIRNELSAHDEKTVMWHMLECPGCFKQYVALKHPGAGLRQARDEMYHLALR